MENALAYGTTNYLTLGTTDGMDLLEWYSPDGGVDAFPATMLAQMYEDENG